MAFFRRRRIGGVYRLRRGLTTLPARNALKPKCIQSMSEQPVELNNKTVVLVGLMGAGKTSVGRILAQTLNLPFVDSDEEVEIAAGCSIEDIFEIYGEAAFRDVEARVLKRLLAGEPIVLASGGGAYMNEQSRALISETAIAVWLRADLDTLERRTRRRLAGRPLLKGGDASEKLKHLIDERYPVYAEADIIVDSIDEAPEKTSEKVLLKMSELAKIDN